MVKEILNDRAKELGYDDFGGLIETYRDEKGLVRRGVRDKTQLKGFSNEKFKALIEALVPEGNGSTAMRAAAYQSLKKYI